MIACVALTAFWASAQVPVLKYLSSFHTNLFDESAAEIVVYDEDNKQLYFTNADANAVTVLNFSNPENLSEVTSIDCEPYGDGINSVSYSSGYIAVAVQGEEADDHGSVVFFDSKGAFVAKVEVGFLPDMLTFTPDGNKVVVACEGEPSDDYRVDPKGSISVIDVSGGIAAVDQGDVTDLDFMSFNSAVPGGVRVFGPTTYWKDDFEAVDDSIERYTVIDYGATDMLFYDDFENTTNELGNFDTLSRKSDKNWVYADRDGDHYAEINGFGGNKGSEDWLITPAVDKGTYENLWLSFEYIKRYDGDGLSVWVSSDYDGKGTPENATWSDVTDEVEWTDGSSWDPEETGGVDITEYAGSTTYVAFKYESTSGAAGGGSLFRIDNIALIGMKEYKGQGFYFDDYNGDHFLEANGYNGDSLSNSWCITPEMNLAHFNGANLSFTSSMNYSGGTMELLISNDYNGGPDPASATWDTLTGMAALSTGGFNEVPSGDIDISAWAGESVYIAFHFTGAPGSGGSRTWQLDDFKLEAKELSAAHNFEPEYVAISDDSKSAFVTLQENNALAVVDLDKLEISALMALGTKDHSIAGNGMDASNKDKKINIATWPTQGYYMPDAIKFASIDGSPYLFSANEGDARDYWFDVDSESECYFMGGLEYDDGECMAYSEETRVEDLKLDETAFPNAANLQLEENLGRLKTTIANGDTDSDGDHDVIYSYGARSFTIWNPLTASVVFDSGDEFEQKTAELFPDGFNATNDENGFDDRSDDKGGEPEAITVAEYADSAYAFIGLERMGGLFVYNVDDPANASFVQYTNNRDFSDTVDIEKPWAGDLGPECIIYIKGEGDYDYVVVANEVSGSISVYEFGDFTNSVDIVSATDSWNLYPNPVTQNILRSNKVDNYKVFDMSGRVVKTAFNTKYINLEALEAGTYMIKDSNGAGKMIMKH